MFTFFCFIAVGFSIFDAYWEFISSEVEATSGITFIFVAELWENWIILRMS